MYKLTVRWILAEASNAWWPWFLYGHCLLYSAVNGEQLRLCPLGVISTKQRSVIVWALNISPQGVIHSGIATDSVSTAHSSDGLSSNVKRRCHLQFNMQMGLNGILNGAFIERTAFPDFPCVCTEFILAVQVTYKSALAVEVIPHPSSRWMS